MKQALAAVSEPRLYTVAEVAEFTRSSPTSVRNMVHRGIIAGIRWGIELRIPHSALEAYIATNPVSGPDGRRNPGRNGRRAGRPPKAPAVRA